MLSRSESTWRINFLVWASTLIFYLVPGVGLSLAAMTALVAVDSAEAHDSDKHNLGVGVPSSKFHVTRATYTLPDIKLVRDDGRDVSLVQEVDDGRPVVVNFIYTTCPGICPIMSLAFSQFQSELGTDRKKVHLVSISVDPEQDTPANLRAYAKKFEADKQWQHYTGTVDASVAAQKAFDAYRGDKMAHDPLTLMRLAPGQPWIRIDGFATGFDLFQQYASLVGAQLRK